MRPRWPRSSRFWWEPIHIPQVGQHPLQPAPATLCRDAGVRRSHVKVRGLGGGVKGGPSKSAAPPPPLLLTKLHTLPGPLAGPVLPGAQEIELIEGILRVFIILLILHLGQEGFGGELRKRGGGVSQPVLGGTPKATGRQDGGNRGYKCCSLQPLGLWDPPEVWRTPRFGGYT